MAKIGDVQEISIDALIPYERNAKIHNKEQIKKIADSISEFGFLNPVLIDRNYNVVAGHGRILAAEMLRMDKVPCLFIEGLSDAQKRAYIIADNRLSELAEWDTDLIDEELLELNEMGFDVTLTGFELPMDMEEDEPKSVDISDNISVVIECESEIEAEDIFNKLSAEGYRCKISTL